MKPSRNRRAPIPLSRSIPMFSSILALAALISTASAQDVVMQTGEVVGTVSVGGTCVSQSSTCLNFQNDHPGRYPMEIVSVSYVSVEGRLSVASPPVIGARLQCVLPNDGRPCAPVLAYGEMAAMQLPAPPAAGELITVKLRIWDPPGSEAGKPEREVMLSGTPVLLIGDPVAAMQTPATPVKTVTVVVGESSNFVNWRKGS